MAVDNSKSLNMISFQSKSDKFGWGANIVLGQTGRELCPVATVLSYVAVRSTRQGPFFQSREASRQVKICDEFTKYSGVRGPHFP